MFKNCKKDPEDKSKTGPRSSADSRIANGDFGGHALGDSQLGHAYGGVNTSAQVTCPRCKSCSIKTKLKTIGANGPIYSHECTCGYKWETVDAAASI